MSMRFELTGECAAVSLVVGYAPTEANPNTELKYVFWKKLGHLVEQILTKELMPVGTGIRKRADWEDGRVR